MPTVSCVIAAYNEEKGIGTVLKAAVGHPLLLEVIVVDDGSHDRTAKIVRGFPSVKLIQQGTNKGKSVAAATGIAAARGEFICALDADLVNFTAEHVTKLIRPVLDGRAFISISLRGNCPWFYRPIHFDFLSGERVYPKSFLAPHLDEIMRLPNFGLEVFMNRLIISEQHSIAVVFLSGVISPLKYHKSGLLSGFMGDIGMARDILKTVSAEEFVSQIYHLLKLRVPTSEKFSLKQPR